MTDSPPASSATDSAGSTTAKGTATSTCNVTDTSAAPSSCTAVAKCPAYTMRTGCSALTTVPNQSDPIYANGVSENSRPLGSDSCECYFASIYSGPWTGNCYAYCVDF